MTLRGKAAIIGFAELPNVRSLPGRSSASLLSEVSAMAIRDAGLRKEEIDGLITHHESNINAHSLAEYMRITPAFSEAVTTHGASGAYGVELAAMVVDAGIADYVLCAFGGTSDPQLGGYSPSQLLGRSGARPSLGGEWEGPFGPVVAMNGWYGLLKQRHMHQYGTTDKQFARIAANQRFNGLTNPNALFRGQPITVEDVLNSRYTNEPIHLLESVMPSISAAAVVVTTAERARRGPNPPVYVLGAGGSSSTHDVIWQKTGDITVTPVTESAARAYRISGYGPKDLQFAEMYDWYTILEAVSLEDAGICKKGEIGGFFESTDTTFKGSFPINTDGGQLSGGQGVGIAGGFRHVVEAARQIMGRAEDRQVARNDLCLVNGWGGTASVMVTLVLGSQNAL